MVRTLQLMEFSIFWSILVYGHLGPQYTTLVKNLDFQSGPGPGLMFLYFSSGMAKLCIHPEEYLENTIRHEAAVIVEASSATWRVDDGWMLGK